MCNSCGGAALLFKWLLSQYGFSDAGALGALSMGLITNQMWARGWPGPVSSGPNPSFAADAERYLGLFWKWIAQPLLFGSIGSGCDHILMLCLCFFLWELID
jgi:hypothetical protein